MNKIRILIVDDEILLLESLELILSMNESFQVAGVAHDGMEALDILEQKEGRYSISRFKYGRNVWARTDFENKSKIS